MDNSIIKGILHNKDGTVDYVINQDKLDEILKPYIGVNPSPKSEKPRLPNNWIE